MSAIKNGVCTLKSPQHCAWCQDSGHEAFRAQLGATLPCTHGGPWRVDTAQEGTFPVVVRRKGCSSCKPMRFG